MTGDMSELIEDIRALRLTLTADLAAAAAALDEEQLEVARDIVAADRVEVRRLGADSLPRRPEPAGTRRRAMLLLPAIPAIGALAITSAAALSVMHGGGSAKPSGQAHGAAPATAAAIERHHQTAASTLQRLARIVGNHVHEAQVVEVANHLHNQLSAIIAMSSGSAAEINQVRHLLDLEQQVLERGQGRGEAIALAASRELAQTLKTTALPTPSTTPTPLSVSTSAPTSKPVAKPSTSPKPTHSTSPKPHRTATPKPSGSHSSDHDPQWPNPLGGQNLIDKDL